MKARSKAAWDGQMTRFFGATRAGIASAVAVGVLHVTVAFAAPEVSIKGGNVVLSDGGKTRVLTHSGADGEVALSPDARTVVFTRGALSDDSGDCRTATAGKQALMSVDVATGRERPLAVARAGRAAEAQFCNFRDKQFSSDGHRLYFSTPGWATSGALWVFDVSRGRPSYLLPSNGFVVLSNCEMTEYRDKLAVSQHRYFAFGGSFDWYWLFDATGGKEVGPIGETLDMASDACGQNLAGKSG